LHTMQCWNVWLRFWHVLQGSSVHKLHSRIQLSE
jgi:hypothetical protein